MQISLTFGLPVCAEKQQVYKEIEATAKFGGERLAAGIVSSVMVLHREEITSEDCLLKNRYVSNFVEIRWFESCLKFLYELQESIK